MGKTYFVTYTVSIALAHRLRTVLSIFTVWIYVLSTMKSKHCSRVLLTRQFGIVRLTTFYDMVTKKYTSLHLWLTMCDIYDIRLTNI